MSSYCPSSVWPQTSYPSSMTLAPDKYQLANATTVFAINGGDLTFPLYGCEQGFSRYAAINPAFQDSTGALSLFTVCANSVQDATNQFKQLDTSNLKATNYFQSCNNYGSSATVSYEDNSSNVAYLATSANSLGKWTPL